MNLVIMSSAASCLNSCMYTSSRMLYGLGIRGEAPKFLAKISGNGVPANGLIFTFAIVLIGAYFNYVSPDTVFYYVSSATVTASLWAWGAIMIEQMNFRKRLTPEQVAKLKFKMPLYPFANYLVLAFIAAVCYGSWFDDDNRLGLYAGAVWYILLLVCYEVFKVKDRQLANETHEKTEW